MCCTDSDRRTEANRRNARKSTGPRTAEGKARSSQNAFVHGLRAASVLVRGENPRELVAYRMSIIRSTNPRNALEMEAVELIIRGGWKLRRYQAAEVEILQRPQGLAKVRCKPNERLANVLFADKPYFGGLTRYESQYVRMIERGVKLLRELREEPIHGVLGEFAGEMLDIEEAHLSEMDAAQPPAPTQEPSNPTPEPANAPNEPKSDSQVVSDSLKETSVSDIDFEKAANDLDALIKQVEKNLARPHAPKEGS